MLLQIRLSLKNNQEFFSALETQKFKHALVTYLNGNEYGSGFEPVYRDRRLQIAYGGEVDKIRNQIQQFFSSFPQPDPKQIDLNEYCILIEQYALREFDWMDSTLAKAIVNYFHFQYSR